MRENNYVLRCECNLYDIVYEFNMHKMLGNPSIGKKPLAQQDVLNPLSAFKLKGKFYS